MSPGAKEARDIMLVVVPGTKRILSGRGSKSRHMLLKDLLGQPNQSFYYIWISESLFGSYHNDCCMK